jgi:hypothetical protein
MEDKIIQSIDRQFKRIFWLLVPVALAFILLCSTFAIVIVQEYFTPHKKMTEGKVVCARMDLAVGDEITKLNVELRNLPTKQWPKNLVSPGHAFAIIGHKMVRPLAKGKPLDWYDTDVPIPTPSVSSETLNYQKNPEPWHSPNGDTP